MMFWRNLLLLYMVISDKELAMAAKALVAKHPGLKKQDPV